MGQILALGLTMDLGIYTLSSQKWFHSNSKSASMSSVQPQWTLQSIWDTVYPNIPLSWCSGLGWFILQRVGISFVDKGEELQRLNIGWKLLFKCGRFFGTILKNNNKQQRTTRLNYFNVWFWSSGMHLASIRLHLPGPLIAFGRKFNKEKLYSKHMKHWGTNVLTGSSNSLVLAMWHIKSWGWKGAEKYS